MEKCSTTQNLNKKEKKENGFHFSKKEKEVTPYFLYYSRTDQTVNVTKEVFRKMKLTTIDFSSFKVKVVGETTRKQVKEVFRGLKAQGLSELFSLFSSLVTKTSTLINTANEAVSRINKKFCILMAKLVLELSSFSSDFAGKRIDQFINIILSIYALIDHFTAQGLESIFLAGLYPFFPTCLQNLLKHLQLFTSVKISDDFTLIHTLFDKLESFLTFILTKMGASQSIIDMIIRCFSYLGFGDKHLILNQMDKFREMIVKNPRELSKKDFCDKCLELNEKYESNEGLADWKRRCGSVREECEKWDRFMKIVRANLDSSRQEPNLFVFQGPPGVGKSIFLDQVVSSLGWRKYAHIIPDVNEGRDFYDSYNDEEVFYMDDVGQKGVSQWRTMINMVSSVKLPLDCAEAKLKDTKFFNSHTILVTTNSFTNISSIMRTDGIADVKALWRRGFVFDFSEVKRVEGNFKGRIRFLHYDLEMQQFLPSFPSYFPWKKDIASNFLLKGDDSDFHSARVWMGSIIKGFKIVKDRIKQAYDLTPSMKEQTQHEIDNILEFFSAEDRNSKLKAQGGLLGVEINMSCKEALKTGGLLYLGGLAASRIGNLLYSEFEDWNYMNMTDNECFAEDVDIQHKRKVIQNRLDGHAELFFTGLFSIAAIYASYILITSLGSGISTIANSLVDMGKEAVKKAEQEKQAILLGGLKGEGLRLLGDFSGVHNSVKMIKDHVFECTLRKEEVEVSCCCLVSGRLVLLPDHMNLGSEMQIKVFKEKARNHVLLDWITISSVYSNAQEDVCVFELPKRYPNPFKSLSNWIGKEVEGKEEDFLVTPWGFQLVNAGNRLDKVRDYSFRAGKIERLMKTRENYITYDAQAAGMCGSPIFSLKKGILGFHVAGSELSGIGVGSNWSEEVIKVLKELFEQDKPLVSLPFDISERVLPDSSVCKLDNPCLISNTPSVSNLEPTCLYGIYPVNRHPADLDKYGEKTLKVVASKSFKNCRALNVEEVAFAQKILEEIVIPFGVLTDEEVIKGTEELAGLNPKSSNGFGCFKEKSKYIDFEKSCCTPLFKQQLEEIEEQARKGDIDFKNLLWFECLKDEIRNDEKEGVPRSFRVGTIHQQFLMKKYFGKMVENIMKNRNFNKIMVGCNPVKEWPIIYEDLKSGKVFAGDIKNWDGGMNPIIQELIAVILSSRSLNTNVNLVQALVGTLTNSVVIVNKDLYITTHSMPSGSYLTAIVNSIVNKLYTAIWYFRNVKNPTTYGYWTDVSDYVYGDDKLNVVRNHFESLNAITMEDFFESVGLGFTDASKNKIVNPFQPISEVSFLKRNFVFHFKLNKIVCPLELRVIQNTLSFYDGTKDQRTVIRDKIHAVQREMFLHPDHDYLLTDLYFRLSHFRVSFEKLPREVLMSFYLDDNCEIPLSFSSNNLYF